MLHVKAKDLDSTVPYFENLCECIGAVITMNNGDKFYYHRLFTDSAKSLKKELKKQIKQGDIQEIELFGGNVNPVCFPSDGRSVIITTYNNDNKVLSIENNINYHQNNPEWSGLNFKCSQLSGFEKLESKKLLITDILSKEESASYDRFVNDKIEAFRTNDEKFIGEVRSGNKVYSFEIKDIKDFQGYRNRKVMESVLEETFPIFKNRITHQYAPIGANLVIEKNGVDLPEQFGAVRGVARGTMPFNPDEVSSIDNENEFYNKHNERSLKYKTKFLNEEFKNDPASMIELQQYSKTNRKREEQKNIERPGQQNGCWASLKNCFGIRRNTGVNPE